MAVRALSRYPGRGWSRPLLSHERGYSHCPTASRPSRKRPDGRGHRVTVRALLWLVAVACSGEAATPPVALPSADPANESAAASAFPKFEPIRSLIPLVANLSPTRCLVVWSAETDYRGTFLFGTDDAGATFTERGELIGTAAEAVVAGERVIVLVHHVGGGVSPVIVHSDDAGVTWTGHDVLEREVHRRAVSGDNTLDQLAFRDVFTGRVRWPYQGWLVTGDGGATWALVPEAPGWEPALAPDGPCRSHDGALERRTATGWEVVPGAPGARW